MEFRTTKLSFTEIMPIQNAKLSRRGGSDDKWLLSIYWIPLEESHLQCKCVHKVQAEMEYDSSIWKGTTKSK